MIENSIFTNKELQVYLFVQSSRFILAIAFVSHQLFFDQNLTQVITLVALVAEWIDTYGIYHWSSYRK